MWLASDAALLAATLFGSGSLHQSGPFSAHRVLAHVRRETPQLVLNITGAVVVECLARVWRDLKDNGLSGLERTP